MCAPTWSIVLVTCICEQHVYWFLSRLACVLLYRVFLDYVLNIHGAEHLHSNKQGIALISKGPHKTDFPGAKMCGESGPVVTVSPGSLQ